MTASYEDIINLPHHVSPSHPPMPPSARAAQFAPFAALTGYEAAIREKNRLTRQKKELSEEMREELRLKLNQLSARIREHPPVRIVWFQPDDRKDGGEYRETSGYLKKIDAYERILVMSDGTRIPLEDISEIHPGPDHYQADS